MMIGKQSPESLGCGKVNRIYFSAGSAIYAYGIYLVHQFLHDFIISWAQNYEKIWYLSTTSGSNLGLLTRKPKSLSHREYIYYQVFHLYRYTAIVAE